MKPKELMKVYKYPEKKEWQEILKRPAIDTSALNEIVKTILEEVKQNKDAALRKFTLQFDKVLVDQLAVSEDEINNAEGYLSIQLKEAIRIASFNIEQFHKMQLQPVEIIETTVGVKCWRKSIPIEKIGLYIPGGSAPLFSTILMLGIPARIAGCKEIILCSPPDTQGKLHPAILFAAKTVGITKIFRIGGVQAIAAMAYGTESIPVIHKIFGPGNQYVMHAKQIVQQDGIAIDLPAGPSELAIYADETAIPAFLVSDILSQAEHGVDSQVLLVSDYEFLVAGCMKELNEQIEILPRKEITKRALENSKIIIVKNEIEAMQLLNEYAPEHLILACEKAEVLAEKVVNAGSVFLGNYSPESAGDYATGTNHTLPTNGNAKAYSGVSVDSFVKKITFQQITEKGLNNIGNVVITMAEAEGLHAHAEAIRKRFIFNP